MDKVQVDIMKQIYKSRLPTNNIFSFLTTCIKIPSPSSCPVEEAYVRGLVSCPDYYYV